MSNDSRCSDRGDAQQTLPRGAQTARDGLTGEEIIWVGEQRLMEGYCGRAVVTGHATGLEPAGRGENEPRPVVMLQRARSRVVRIGPRPTTDVPLARAA